MTESGERYTYYVTLYRPDLPPNAQPWDSGILSVYSSKEIDKANFIAKDYAKFFKVKPKLYTEKE